MRHDFFQSLKLIWIVRDNADAFYINLSPTMGRILAQEAKEFIVEARVRTALGGEVLRTFLLPWNFNRASRGTGAIFKFDSDSIEEWSLIAVEVYWNNFWCKFELLALSLRHSTMTRPRYLHITCSIEQLNAYQL